MTPPATSNPSETRCQRGLPTRCDSRRPTIPAIGGVFQHWRGGVRACSFARHDYPHLEGGSRSRNPASMGIPLCRSPREKLSRRNVDEKSGSAVMPERSWCTGCQALKPVTEFRANPRMSDGLDSWCRSCHVEATSGGGSGIATTSTLGTLLGGRSTPLSVARSRVNARTRRAAGRSHRRAVTRRPA